MSYRFTHGKSLEVEVPCVSMCCVGHGGVRVEVLRLEACGLSVVWVVLLWGLWCCAGGGVVWIEVMCGSYCCGGCGVVRVVLNGSLCHAGSLCCACHL